MPRLRVRFHTASSLQGKGFGQRSNMEKERAGAYLSGYTGCAKEAGILVHVQRCAADGVRFEHASAEVMNEANRRENERRRARELLPPVWGWVISGRGQSA